MSLSIRRRLTLAFVALAALPLLVAALANAVLYYRQHTAAELAHLRELSLRVGVQVCETLRRGERALDNLLLYRDLMRLAPAEQGRLLTELLARHDFIREAALLDRNGHERVRRSAHAIVLPGDLRDVRGDAAFHRPFESGDAYYGPIHYAPSGEPLLTVAIPVREPYTGDVEAVLSAQLRLKPLWDDIAQLDLAAATQVYVLDEGGAVVAHRNPSVVLRGTRAEPPATPGLGHALDGGEAFAAASTIPVGQRSLRVVAERDWYHAVAPAAINLLVSGGILLLALLLALAAGAYALRRIVRPIVGVAGTARAIAAGGLDQRVSIDSDDEIGDLSRSFNAMTDHLQRTLTALTDEIAVRERAETALRESEARYRLLVENQNDLLVKIDPADGRLLFVSPSYCRMFGKTQEELLGRPFLPLVHEEDRLRVRASLERLFQPPFTTNHEERALTGDGWRWLSWSNRAVLDPDGRVIEAIAVGRDITERKETELQLARYREQLEELVAQRTHELERANAGLTEEIEQRKHTEQQLKESEEFLRNAKEAAEAASRAKSVFLANMSHELRTPMNAILGFAQLMGSDPSLGSDLRASVATIRRSGHHLLTLINDILEIAKIEAGKSTVEARPFDLADLIDTIVDMIRLRAESKGLAVEVLREPDVPRYVCGDDKKLRQVLVNLLGNAVKFTADGHVRLRVAAADGAIRFSVSDTGYGIDADEQVHVFEAFYQTHGAGRHAEGTGLGLTISREYVTLMGGELTLESSPGRGTTFRFALPLAAADATPADPVQRGRRVTGLEPGQPAYRILIAEDKPDNRLLLRRLLESIGLEVREAEHGEEAVALFQSWRPHLIWMDMRMPVMDGYEATRRIKATPEGGDTVVLALTAGVFEEDRAEVLAAGCDGFLRKPLDVDEALAAMAEHLGLRYLYADTEAAPAAAGAEPDRAALAALPVPLCAELAQAAEALDVAGARSTIARIRERDRNLGAALGRLLDDYRFDKLLTLCETEPATEEAP